MTARYALYAAPAPGSTLAYLGASWLGRDADDGTERARPPVPGFTLERIGALTREPARYGLHGTLKPPFALAEGSTAEALLAEAERFAYVRRPVVVPALRVAALGNFLALVPEHPCPGIEALATECVRIFDSFRAPPPPEETAKRRAAGLTIRQERLLAAWGYPFVMEEFRFHLTLTGRLHDPDERARLREFLDALFGAAVGDRPFAIDALAVFRQECRDAPFQVIGRFPFAAATTRPASAA